MDHYRASELLHRSGGSVNEEQACENHLYHQQVRRDTQVLIATRNRCNDPQRKSLHYHTVLGTSAIIWVAFTSQAFGEVTAVETHPLDGQLHALWAKAGSGGIRDYHPILNHSVDVANVIRLLSLHCLGETIRFSISSQLSVDSGTSTLITAVLGGLHDMGKAAPAFQRLRPDLAERVEATGLHLGFGDYKRHGTITASELSKLLLIGASPLRANAHVARVLACISGAHHGVFPLPYDMQHLGSDSLGDKSWDGLRTRLVAALWRILNEGEEPEVTLGQTELTDPALVPLLAGLISISDWIGSNTDFFPFDSATDQQTYQRESFRRAESALRSTGWLPGPLYASAKPFVDVFGFPPNAMQYEAARLAGQQDSPFLMVIEAAMGQGKTEAALFVADTMLCSGRSRGLYVALPTQATSNAMYERVKFDYLRSRGHSGIEDKVQLVHGNALIADLIRLACVDCDKEPDGEGTVSAASWFSARKRSLLAPFGIGTIDQALLAVLQTRHWFVRLFGLANKVVVFDEVHAYDTYMSTLLDRLLQWLSALDCTVVLLSATLPQRRLSQLISAYSGRQLTEAADYPRVTVTNRETTVCASVPVGENQKAIALDFHGDQAGDIAHVVAERISNGGCAAVICNTVARAQEVYRSISNAVGDCKCILFHARTPFLWRMKTEEEVLRLFGKPKENGDSRDRPEKAVVVATQVIEQSLDLDFDWMLTEMAPIDLVLQRLGRMHRHNRPLRPAAFRSPVLTVLSDGEIEGPPPVFQTSGIYERYLLLRSWLAIRESSSIQIPSDIDRLVQWVYDESVPDDLTPEWKDALKSSRDKLNWRRDEDFKKASQLVVPKPGYPEDILAQFNKQLSDDEDPSTHESVRAATRSGDPSTQVACLRRCDDRLYPMCGDTAIDLDTEPSELLTVELLGSSLSVQTKGLYFELLHQPTPRSWSKNPYLRFHRLLEFIDGEAHLGAYHLTLSRELGLVIRKE